jgi:DNA-binding SARP family transcriptional activator
MDFRILGPLEALHEGRELALGGGRQRALLALLLLHANETVSTDRLIDELWGETPPATGAKSVQVTVSRLRKALAADGADGPDELILTRDRGYELRLDPERLDAHRFELLTDEGRDELAAADAAQAALTLREALALWRGPCLGELAYEPFAQQEIARLNELRVTAEELLIEAKLSLGEHDQVVGPLEALISAHPYRERLRAQLMLALYRSDRQADALQAYQDARVRLVEELGIEPGERLRELERAVLEQDPDLSLEVPAPAEPDHAEPPREPDRPVTTGEAPRSARRLVSIVFADLVGSTGLGERLDPESMHDLLDRYTAACSQVIERHGGTVEGFIGDAVVGVFGMAELHEDDALRAVRAAVELREAARALSAELERERGVAIAIKLGVESGEVFVGAGSRRPAFAAGDAFNVASRLEGTAPQGEILLGENTHRLVHGAVRAEPLEPLQLRGRSARVRAWRLLELEPGDASQLVSAGTAFVGREQEMEGLRTAYARAASGRSCNAVTVVGPPGIGKSRLVQELVAEIDEQATVLVGRCPSYGDGVTYRPLAEIVRQVGGSDPRKRVEELFTGDERAARLVLGAIGLAQSPAQTEETFWAVRRLLERLARDQPLAVIVEDVHWAEPTLLDLLDYLVAFSDGHPILLVCLARPEFLEARPNWVAPLPNRSLLILDRLSDGQALALVEGAGSGELGSDTAASIVRMAEGNPLFLEQLVAVGAENGRSALPSTIQTVLAARIEHLEPGARAALEHGSVQGQAFFVGAIEERLSDEVRAQLATHLVSLVHKGLIRPERSDLPGQDSFRFAHALLRETAYQGLSKEWRADLHEHVARWLEAWPDAQDETLGYHLGEAWRLLRELGRDGERERALAAAAAERLASAADGASLRGDPMAAARLLERAESLLEADAMARAELLPALGAALFEAGRVADAAHMLDEAVAEAPDPRLRARAQVERELVRLEAETSVGSEQARDVADAAMPILEGEGDDYGKSRVWLLRGQVAWGAGRVATADGAWSEAAESARRAGDERVLFEVIGWRAIAAALGPARVDEAIERCEAFRDLVQISPSASASTLNPLALLHAMKAEFDVADRLLEDAGELLHQLGGLGAGVSHLEAMARLLAGQPDLAEATLRADVDTLSSMSEGGALATTMALLAQAVYALGRFDEAGDLCLATDRIAAEEDAMTQVIRRSVQAKVFAHQGRCPEAEALAREAVATADSTDLLSLRGDAMLDLAEVVRICDRPSDAERAIRSGLALYDQKGNAAAAARARSQLD